MSPEAVRSMQSFAAPWSPALQVSTVLIVGFCALVTWTAGAVAGLLILGVLALAFAYSVRGYSVGHGELLVHHPGWSTRIDLSRLVAVEENPAGLRSSLRVGGIGGVFASVGFFWSPGLGWLKAYATDVRRAVMLDFGEQKILLTPDRPSEFAAAVRLQHFYQGP